MVGDLPTILPFNQPKTSSRNKHLAITQPTNKKMVARSRHVFSLRNAHALCSSELGSLQRVTADELPILNNLSMKRLVLAPGAIQEPHWHANFNELTYCIKDQLLISILDTGSEFSTFTF
jgi:oxalate decarboxylase